MTQGLKPFEDALYNDMLSHIKQTDLSVPVRRGDYYYYSRTEEGKQYSIQCRKKGSLEGKEDVLLDLNELGKGKIFAGLGAFEVSDDQDLLASTIDYTGYRQFTLHVKDLRSGATLPDTIERADSVAWAADNRTLFVTTEDPVTKRANQAWRHTLGQSDSEPVYEAKDETFRLCVEKTRDKKYVLLESISTDTSEVRYLRADRPKSDFAPFLARKAAPLLSRSSREPVLREKRQGRQELPGLFDSGGRSRSEEPEGVHRSRSERPHSRYRSVPRFRSVV